MSFPDDGDDRGVPGHAELGDGLTGGRRALGQGDLHEPGVLELQESDEGADRHRLLHEGGEQVGRGHRDVDAPRLVEQPLVVRVVDARDHARHSELLLRQQRDDEVVLVIAGCGDDDVDAFEAGLVQRADLARVGDEPLHVERGAQAGDEVGVLLDEHDLVAGVAEVAGDVDADVPRSGDGDLHECLPSSARRAPSSSRESRRTAM